MKQRSSFLGVCIFVVWLGAAVLLAHITCIRFAVSNVGPFVDNGDGTLTDQNTGLMWERKGDDAIYSWLDAQRYCDIIGVAAYTDWRLPTEEELKTVSLYGLSYEDLAQIFDYSWDMAWSSTPCDFEDPEVEGYYARGLGAPFNEPFEPSACISSLDVACVIAVRSGVSNTTTTITEGSTTTTTVPTTTSTAGPATTTTILPCPTKFLYGEYAEETVFLRCFRDDILSQTPEGQEIIRLYYELSPMIVKAMEEDGALREEVKEVIDEIIQIVTGE